MKERFEITYDYEDDQNIIEEFEGDWFELKQYIKQMKACGCYNIDANCISSAEY